MCIWKGFGTETTVTVSDRKPMVAYKEFRFNDNTLHSPKQGTKWNKKTLRVITKITADSSNSVGVYSYKEKSYLESKIRNPYGTKRCFAKVEIWGKVAVHATKMTGSKQSGYRSEHCRIVELFMNPRDWERYAQRIADKYDITVTEL